MIKAMRQKESVWGENIGVWMIMTLLGSVEEKQKQNQLCILNLFLRNKMKQREEFGEISGLEIER